MAFAEDDNFGALVANFTRDKRLLQHQKDLYKKLDAELTEFEKSIKADDTECANVTKQVIKLFLQKVCHQPKDGGPLTYNGGPLTCRVDIFDMSLSKHTFDIVITKYDQDKNIIMLDKSFVDAVNKVSGNSKLQLHYYLDVGIPVSLDKTSFEVFDAQGNSNWYAILYLVNTIDKHYNIDSVDDTADTNIDVQKRQNKR